MNTPSLSTPSSSSTPRSTPGTQASSEERYCYNCGTFGHLHRHCKQPITSYGMIVYHRNLNGEIKYLLIQRNFSPEYRTVVHNLKTHFDNKDTVHQLVDHLTELEVRYLQHYPFPELFRQLTQFYSLKKTMRYQKNVEFHSACFKKFIRGSKNRSGEFLKLEQMTSATVIRPLEPDWGFPKGRRNKRVYESDLECAKREVFEETEIGPQHYTVTTPDIMFKEVFDGTNGTGYKHVYFLAETSEYHPVYINPFNKHQLSEVRKIGWFSYQEACDLFRDYHTEKKEMLRQVQEFLTER